VNGVQIVTDLAATITRLFNEAGASQVERYAALDIARSLVSVSEASLVISACEQSSGAHSQSAEESDGYS
jgi:hypothetical protein